MNTLKSQLKSDHENMINGGVNRTKVMKSSIKDLKSFLYILKKQESANFFLKDIVPVLGCILDYMRYDDTRSLSLMIILTLKDTFGEIKLGNEIISILDDITTMADTRADRYASIEILGVLYSVLPNVCTNTFLKDDIMVKLLANEITFLLTSRKEQLLFDGGKNLRSILLVFSGACIDEACRKLIAKMYLGLLVKTLKVGNSTNDELELECLAGTVVIKIYKCIERKSFEKEGHALSLSFISEILINGLLSQYNHKITAYSVEGLAFLSLSPEIRRLLRKDDNFLTALIEDKFLEDSNEISYGTLCIVNILTMIPSTSSEKQQSMEKLRSYAELSQMDPRTGKKLKVSRKDTKEEVIKFSTSLMKSKDLLGMISKIIKKFQTSGIIEQAIYIIHNLCNNKSIRTDVVKHGGLGILLSYLASHSDGIKYNPDTFCEMKKPIIFPQVRQKAISALAKIIMSHNPKVLFYQKFDIFTPVAFLLEEIVQYDIDTGGRVGKTPLDGLPEDQLNAIDCFEAIVALTNLTSVDEMKIKNIVLRLGWSSIYNLTLSENYQIQRTDLELLSNLMLSPMCSEKFFNWNTKSDENYQHFRRLCQLINLVDRDSQIAVLNIFANSSDYNIIGQLLCQSEFFMDHFMDVMVDKTADEEIQLRCFYILANLLNISASTSKIYQTVRSKLGSIITYCCKEAKDPKLRQIAQEIQKTVIS